MKNTDMVTHVGYTVGGKSGKNTLGAKVRFVTSSSNFALRVKELDKMGVDEQHFTNLPHPMNKSDAAQWFSVNTVVTNAQIKAAIAHAVSRLVHKN
jgi:hypothetical protein